MGHNMNTSWMWPNSAGGVEGAVIEEGKVRWFDEPGCACGSNDSEQTIADFLEKGPRFLQPPQDVLTEMQTTAQALLEKAPQGTA